MVTGQTVQKADTTTSVAVSPTSTTLGDVVTVTAAVTDSSGGSTGTPTGLVTFFDNGTPIGTGTLSVVGGMDQATFTTSLFSAAASPHSITAAYEGDANFNATGVDAGSTATGATETVALRATTVGVTLTPSAVMVGQPSTTTVTVTDTGTTNPPGAADSWIATSGTPTTGTTGATATLFADGMVLVAGGTNSGAAVNAYIYNAVSKTFTTTGNLNTARTGATATLLPNGDILIAGGSSDGTPAKALNTAELYNPVTSAFTVAGSESGSVMTAVRFGATATLLQNGQVLIAGGQNSGGALSSAELYNPATDTFTATTGTLTTARYDAAAMLLANGSVLIAGGTGASGTLNSAELYSAGAGTFASTGTMTAARTGATATLLLNGNVLIAGGSTDGSTPLNTAEIYTAGGSFSASNSTLNTPRFNGTATLFPNGMVLLVGGASGSTAELYDPDSDKFDATGGLQSTDQPSLTATLLNKDHVLITGLTSGGSPDAELYTPSFDPLGTVGLTSSDTSAMPDSFGAACVLTVSGAGVSTCTSTVTPGEVGTSPHTITGTYPADAVHSGSDNTAPLTVNACTSNCAVGVACTSDANCASNACDGITLTCDANQCADNRKDGNETDVDCGGGTCATCAVGLGCQLDRDCTSNACDGIALTCDANQCADNRRDGAETDVDCGGGTCPACALAKNCNVDSDCTSNACDALSLTCVANQCADHRQDGNETAVDCGGGTCPGCASGQACNINSDCQPGLFCSSGVCQ
jgi:hypothetical protein